MKAMEYKVATKCILWRHTRKAVTGTADFSARENTHYIQGMHKGHFLSFDFQLFSYTEAYTHLMNYSSLYLMCLL